MFRICMQYQLITSVCHIDSLTSDTIYAHHEAIMCASSIRLDYALSNLSIFPSTSRIT